MLLCVPATAGAATYPAGFEEQTIVAGLNQPTGTAWAPDGRMFVIEKGGLLKVVPAGGSTATTVQDLDLRNEVNSAQRPRPARDRGGQQLCLQRIRIPALHLRAGAVDCRTAAGRMASRLDRVQISASNAAVSRTTILGTRDRSLGVCPAPNNGGRLYSVRRRSPTRSAASARRRTAPFGWEVATRPATAAVDPLAFRTYDPQSMAGKIMHIDRNGRGLPGHPFCPANTT